MAVRQIQKPHNIPPAHLYLEDIEQIVKILMEANTSHDKSVRFVVGQRECDTIEDLKKIVTRWSTFEVIVGNYRFYVQSFGSDVIASDKAVSRILQIVSARQSTFRTFMRQSWGGSVISAISVFALLRGYRGGSTSIVIGGLVILVLSLWTTFGPHTQVDNRYSYEIPTALSVLTGWLSKAFWLALAAVVGSVLTLITQHLWHHFFK